MIAYVSSSFFMLFSAPGHLNVFIYSGFCYCFFLLFVTAFVYCY